MQRRSRRARTTRRRPEPASTTQVAELPPLKVVDPAYHGHHREGVHRLLPLRQRRAGSSTTPFRRHTRRPGVVSDMADRNELVVRSVLDDAMAKRAVAAGCEHAAQARHVLRHLHGLGGRRARRADAGAPDARGDRLDHDAAALLAGRSRICRWRA